MRRLALCALLSCFPPAAARAAPPAPGAPGDGPPGRTVAAILADVVKALGSEAAWKAHRACASSSR